MIEANYKYARDMARKILKQYKANSVPTDLKKICDGYGIEYIEIDDQDELDGALIKIDGMTVAMLNKAKSYVRGRFTLAHELAHIFLHHDKRDFYDHNSENEPDFVDFHESKPAKEQEADAFASELLIPYEQLKNYQDKFANLEELARLFQVSKPAMSIAVANFFKNTRVSNRGH